MTILATKNINARIQQRYDTAANWTTNDPVLLAGELGIEAGTGLIKIGDGTSSWSELSYINDFGQSNSSGVTAATSDAISIAELQASGVPMYISTTAE